MFGLEDPDRYHDLFLDRVRLRGKEDTVPVCEYHAGDFTPTAKLFDEIRDPKAPEKAIEIYRIGCMRG